MAGSVNKAILIGHLGKDPEIKKLNSGAMVANFRLATSESWRDKNTGERVERTEWHTVVIWNENLVKVAEAYLKKGSKVYIEGQIQTRKWQDQGGNDRYSTEVVVPRFNGVLTLLDKAERSSSDDGERESGRAPARSTNTTTAQALDDEIPF